jgi:hypothetical protein
MSVDQVVDSEDGDVVHQQGHDNFVDLPAGAQQPGNPGPQPAEQEGDQKHGGDHQDMVFNPGEQGDPGCATGSHVNLPLGADIPDLHPEGN